MLPLGGAPTRPPLLLRSSRGPLAQLWSSAYLLEHGELRCFGDAAQAVSHPGNSVGSAVVLLAVLTARVMLGLGKLQPLDGAAWTWRGDKPIAGPLSPWSG